MQIKRIVAGLAVGIALVGGGVASKTIYDSSASSTTLASRNGTLQAKYHNTPDPVVPFLGPFKSGQCGPAIKIMDRALIHLHFRIHPAKSCFGAYTKLTIVNYQKHLHFKPTGIYTLVVHNELVKHNGYVKSDRILLQALQQAQYNAMVRKNVLVIAGHAKLVGGTLNYSQSSSRTIFPAWPRLPPATDCSGFVTWIAWQAGFGATMGYFGPGSSVGWTGTLGVQGTRVPAGAPLKIGDLVFYGARYPWGHVTMYLGHGLVISHGSIGVSILPYNYNSVGDIRRFIK